MNDTLRIPTRPEVEAFVAEVRARLADLSDEEREELVGGLEADLSDQLADRPDVLSDVLGDPAAYAAELRAAAGLPERARVRRRRLPPVRRVGDLGTDLDRLRAWLLAEVERRPWSRQAWAVAEALRPAWWALRAWIAVTFVDQALGMWEQVTLVPTLGVDLLGPAVLVVAIVVSTLIGLGRLWPGAGPDRPLFARLLLVATNVTAVFLPLTFALPGQHVGVADDWRAYEQGYRDGAHQPGLRVDGDEVTNVFVYNRDGRLVQGAQLYRANGDPLGVRAGAAHTGRGAERTVGCGWFNGTSQLFNVFPLAQREQRLGSCLDEAARRHAGPATTPEPPYAEVPPVTSPVPAPAPTPGPTSRPTASVE